MIHTIYTRKAGRNRDIRAVSRIISQMTKQIIQPSDHVDIDGGNLMLNKSVTNVVTVGTSADRG